MTDTTIDRFFAALSVGDIDTAIDCVSSDAVFEAQGPSSVPIYGRYYGHEGVLEFINILNSIFDTEKFEIYQSLENETTAFAFGYMQHRVIKTNQIFCSEFTIYCQIQNNQISVYKMFEDTAALALAYNN